MRMRQRKFWARVLRVLRGLPGIRRGSRCCRRSWALPGSFEHHLDAGVCHAVDVCDLLVWDAVFACCFGVVDSHVFCVGVVFGGEFEELDGDVSVFDPCVWRWRGHGFSFRCWCLILPLSHFCYYIATNVVKRGPTCADPRCFWV